MMTNDQTAIFWRHDTFLGVCEAIGQDFGFNANWLRLALSVSLLLSPTAVIGIYLGLAVLVLASRLLFPARRPAAPTVDAATPKADNDAVRAELPLAA